LVKYAHSYYAKVYVALNTILTDDEIPDALDIIKQVHECGADGLIIQDMGLLALDLPPIPLIASTQTHNVSLDKIKFLESVGFKRVILARELSLAEIAAIGAQTLIELEAFVHGALCVSYSGQCYMSQAIAGRSGNRGVCAQPCRSRYTLTDGSGKTIKENKFLLSLKDLNLIDRIPDLVKAGVTSFKIEGRYKGLDYIKNVTAVYRMALDRLIQTHSNYSRSSSGTTEFTFTPDLTRTFHRSYTDYFMDGRNNQFASFDTQKATGQYLGKITLLGLNYFQLDGPRVQNGDGLCFFNRNKELAGFRVNQVRGKQIYPTAMKGLFKGARIFRNHDHAFMRCLNKPSAIRRIALQLTFRQNHSGIHLCITDEDSLQSEHFFEISFEAARQPEKMRRQIHSQLSRTGNTCYRVKELRLSSQETGFLTIGRLNQFRRLALDAHTKVREKNYPTQTACLPEEPSPYPDRNLDYSSNILNKHARRFYREHGVKTCDPAFETLKEVGGKTVMTTRYCIRHQLSACLKSASPQEILKDPLKLNDGRHTYRLKFDCSNCRMQVILEK
jgi:collagenase-like PrtC family protease